MTKEEASQNYYTLIELCKIEDVECVKFNMHHVDPLFTLKEKYNAIRTMEFRYSVKDEYELIKCSIYHHILLHYYLCFMFDRTSREFKDARHSFWFLTGKYSKIEKLTKYQVEEFAIYQEKVHKLNQTHEEHLERDRIYRNSDKVKKRKKYLDSRLCYDPRFDMDDINYFVGRYVSYGTLYAWAKWEKEQEHHPMFANITVPKFCKQYLIYDDNGNEMIFDDHMNDEYKKEYDEKRKKIKNKRSRICNQRKRKNDIYKITETINRNNLRHRLCKDPRYNKIQRDSSHKPYEETTSYYTLYNWAKKKLDSVNKLTDVEKEVLGSFTKAEDFAKVYLITDENDNFIYKKPKGVVPWKKDKVDNKHDYKNNVCNYRHRLCLDPRFGKEIKVTEYTNKIWDKKISTYNSLNLWYEKNITNKIVENLSKKEFLYKYILTDKQGNYIYDEKEALKLLDLNQLNVGIENKKKSQDDLTIFDL